MINRSLATFMNAMTGADYTLYPFSSTNEKDYRNLQSIYMDAVFKPNLKYLDFLQEGWRLEHKELDNRDSEYQFKGVVYNEMKGAFAENSQIFGQQIFNKLLPEHTYGFVSGGDPVDIPKLKHVDLVNFHKKYYHPSNAKVFSYGNFELNKNLSYVNDYLKDFEKIDCDSKVPNQTRWKEPRKVQVTCRFDNMGAPMEKQNHIAVAFLMNDIREPDETLLLYVLTELMIKGPNSYFYKSLIEPNISGGYSPMTGYDNSSKDSMLVVGLQDVEVANFEKVESIFESTIKEAIEKGFDQKQIDSVLHNLELNMKHETTKFGLGLLFNLTPIMNHDGDVIEALKISQQMSRLREKIKQNPRYLQEKVREHFQDNNHKLTIIMRPDKKYEEKFAEIEKLNLENKVKDLNESDKERIFEDGIKLAEVQKAHENIDCLPCLKIEEISKPEEIKFSMLKTANTPLQLCPTDTNDIVYFRGMLDASMLDDNERKLLPLFTDLVTQFGTKNYDYREFDTFVSTKTAGLSFNVHLTENVNDYSQYELGLQFGSYALKKNSQDMFNIFAELLSTVEFNDEKRFEMLLENYLSSLSVGIAQSGHLFAMQNASGLVTECGMLRESMSGLEHLGFVKALASKGTGEILEMLKSIGKKVLQKSPVRCALNVTPDVVDESVKSVEKFIKQLPLEKGDIHWNRSNLLNSNSRHNIMNIPINYCAKSLATVPYSHNDYSTLRVLARILSSKFLLPVVREQNGAYGAGAKLGFDGLFNFFSYRDPNTMQTLDTFDKSFDWISENINKVIDEQALFEAKLGVLQQLDAPISKMDQGMENFKYFVSYELFSAHREKVLKTKLTDIMQVAEKYLKDDTKMIVGRSLIGPSNEATAKNSKWIINESN